MKPPKVLLINILALCCLLPGAGNGQAQTTKRTSGADNQINLTADKLSISENGAQIEASGNVEVERQGTTLKAEQINVNRTTEDIEATGKVSLDDPEWKINSAESIRFNLGKETGEMTNADLFIEQGHISIS